MYSACHLLLQLQLPDMQSIVSCKHVSVAERVMLDNGRKMGVTAAAV